MFEIVKAKGADAQGIRDLFIASYGSDYMYPQFYDLNWLKKMIYLNDSLVLVAKEMETGKLVGTSAVILEVGAYSDLVGEFGRLVVHPDYRKHGIGSALMKKRIEHIEKRLHVGVVEARTVHPYAQKISLAHGFSATGFLPLKFKTVKRESVAYLAQYFGNALTFRKNHPRIVPEVYPIAYRALRNTGLPIDVIVDENSKSYPHSDHFQIKNLTTKGYANLLRIERGRLQNREIFGPMRLHYGFFKLNIKNALYLLAQDNEKTIGAIGFTIASKENYVKIFELIAETEHIGKCLGRAISIDDESVSFFHATIEIISGEFYIRDEGSLRGTFLNDEELKPGVNYPIYEGYKIKLGIVQAEVKGIVQERFHDLNEYEKVFTFTHKESTQAQTKSWADEEGSILTSFPQIICLSNYRTYPIFKDATTIGKEQNCDIPIESSFLGSIHCVIKTTDSGHCIRLVGEEDTLVNGEELNWNEETPLTDKSRIVCGDVIIFFFTQDSVFYQHFMRYIAKSVKKDSLPSLEKLQNASAQTATTNYWKDLQYETAHLSIPKEKGSGDFFCIVPKDNALFCILGDVMSHGEVPAMIAQYILGVFRYAVQYANYSISGIVFQIDKLISCYWYDFSLYASAIILKFSEDEMEWIAAGCSNPIVLSKNASEYDIKDDFDYETNVPWLGTFPENIKIDIKRQKITGGDHILLYTDGICETQEAIENPQMTNLDKVNNITIGMLQENLATSPAKLVTEIIAQTSGDFQDDATVAIIKKTAYKRICTHCGEHWPSTYLYCPKHGEELVEVLD